MSEPMLDSFIGWSRQLSWEDVPSFTQLRIKHQLLDYLGVAFAGRALAGLPGWLKVLTDMGGKPEAAIIGGPRVPAPTAALCNAYFGHILEFDDMHDQAILHAGITIVPAVLAAAALRAGADSISGREMCLALLAGSELTCRFGVATELSLVESGWQYTPLFGIFGATLAIARVLGYSIATFQNAFGIAYSLACGNHQSTREGAQTKYAQPGFAAANAITAALMANAGLEGVKQPLTGKDGLNRVYLRDRFDAQRAVEGLGQQFEIDRLSFKPYPTARAGHPAITAALALRAELGDEIQSAERVELIIAPHSHEVAGRAAPMALAPTARVAAQLSIYWTVAVALAHGELTLRHLIEEVPPSLLVRQWISRIECKADPGAKRRDVGGCTLLAHGPFGTRETRVAHAKGHPDDPLSDDEVLAKFNANLGIAGIAPQDATNLAHLVLNLDQIKDVSPLLAMLELAVRPPADLH